MGTAISLVDTVGLTLTEQCQMFLWSIVIGAMFGVLYDVFRSTRKIMTGAILAIVEDILFFAIAAVVIFVFFLRMSQGQIRWFSLVGMCLGGVIYSLTISKLVLKLFDVILFVFIKVIKLIRIILIKFFSPFVYLFSNIAKLFRGIIDKLRKRFKKLLKTFNSFKLKRRKEENMPILKEIQHLPFK